MCGESGEPRPRFSPPSTGDRGLVRGGRVLASHVRHQPQRRTVGCCAPGVISASGMQYITGGDLIVAVDGKPATAA
jgi:hypothetical protein